MHITPLPFTSSCSHKTKSFLKKEKASRKSTGFEEFTEKRLDELRHGGTGNQMLWTASLVS
jgi:hypothetical protein